MIPALHGVIPAVPTPLDADGNPDPQKLVSFIRELFNAGCHGVNLLGTTGEATSFARAARLQVMEAVAKAGLASRMMVGTGAAAFDEAVDLSRAADSMGFAGALLLPPFYYKDIGEAALANFVERLANQSRLQTTRIYLYNIPQFTGLRYTLAMLERLSVSLGEMLAGIKDSSGELAYAEDVATNLGQLTVFPSNEATLRDRQAKCFAGCVSASVNVYPGLACDVFDRGANVDAALYTSMVAVRKALSSMPLVPAVKAAVGWRQKDDTWAATKEPLAPLTAIQTASLIASLELAVGSR
ncbi:dihydrodipicolinate synthase family protein [Paraburkholderia sp. J12]|uniref:dihydrodipicolinate synthase family protein n=1 Tax=Paraburkholderia sp. J12 TaxID=2805432 RepID=UPI002ABE2A26|nr:dihydrodipicolinate synthase family protein [Paraburkholderia sp. J12]